MANSPTSFELGQARKLVSGVNACRRKQRLMVQRDELDRAAWAMVLEMQKSAYRAAGVYPKGMTPVERMRKLGLQLKCAPIEKCEYKPRGIFRSTDGLLKELLDGWLKDVTFKSAVVNPAYVGCGAAYRNNCYVLLLAG